MHCPSSAAAAAFSFALKNMCCTGNPCLLAPMCQAAANCASGAAGGGGNGGRTLFDQVCLGAGTERAASGLYDDKSFLRPGIGFWRCGCCGQALFDAHQMFDSGTGWPSYWAPRLAGSVECARCPCAQPHARAGLLQLTAALVLDR